MIQCAQYSPHSSILSCRAASYESCYGVILAWGSRSPCTDYVGHWRKESGLSCSNSTAGLVMATEDSSNSHCWSSFNGGGDRTGGLCQVIEDWGGGGGRWSALLSPLIAESWPLPVETGHPGRLLLEELVQTLTASLDCKTRWSTCTHKCKNSDSFHILAFINESVVYIRKSTAELQKAGSWELDNSSLLKNALHI